MNDRPAHGTTALGDVEIGGVTQRIHVRYGTSKLGPDWEVIHGDLFGHVPYEDLRNWVYTGADGSIGAMEKKTEAVNLVNSDEVEALQRALRHERYLREDAQRNEVRANDRMTTMKAALMACQAENERLRAAREAALR